MDDSCHIKVQFGSAFNSLDKGPFLLQVERMARSMLGVRAEVFMETMRDLNTVDLSRGRASSKKDLFDRAVRALNVVTPAARQGTRVSRPTHRDSAGQRNDDEAKKARLEALAREKGWTE